MLCRMQNAEEALQSISRVRKTVRSPFAYFSSSRLVCTEWLQRELRAPCMRAMHARMRANVHVCVHSRWCRLRCKLTCLCLGCR